MRDFYIGYQPLAPSGLARRVRAIVVALIVITVGIAFVLALAQQRLPAAFFEYGQPKTFRGTVHLKPYPVLWVSQSDNASAAPYSDYLLVAPGKHGAQELLSAVDHKDVSLRGELIHRDGVGMIQIDPGSIEIIGPSSPTALEGSDLGVMTLSGELVDTKCYLGVMNPGFGKVHRDCAARCISGGIPLALVSEGNVFLLYHPRGLTALTSLRAHIGEKITLAGRVLRRGQILIFQMSPDDKAVESM